MKSSITPESILELFFKCYPEETQSTMLHLEPLMQRMNKDWCLKQINGESWEVRWGLNGRLVTGSTLSLGIMKALISIKEGKR